MPRGFERNIIWDNNDPEKQPRYMPLSEAFRNAGYHPPTVPSDYDLGFLASLCIKA